VGWRQQSSFWILLQCLIVSWFFPSAACAADSVIIGATAQQEQFLACIAHISAGDLRTTPNSGEPLTVIILNHQKFLQTRGAFHAYRTVSAFSNLTIRRIYLSSRVFRDYETALRSITHELGHFETQSLYEEPAEIAAERIRWRARQICGSDGRLWADLVRSTVSYAARASALKVERGDSFNTKRKGE
jgi:hypothetical protein